MNKAVIIVPTNGKYIDVCANFLQMLDKYWNDCPYPVIVSSYGEKHELKGAINLYNQNATSIVDCVRSAIRKYPAEYYFSFLGDAFIVEKVNTSFVIELLKELKNGNIEYCNISYVKSYRRIVPYGDYLRLINTDDRYSHSFVAFIASKKYMENVLITFKNDYAFEKYYLFLNGKNKYFKNHVAVKKNYFHIMPSITQGKWDRIAYYKLKKDNVDIKFANRELRSWPDTIVQHLHDLFIGAIPINMRKTIKDMYVKITGKKFVIND